MKDFVIERDSPLTAWGQVQRDVRRRIELGEFISGGRIPSEADLVDQYGVSRETVRRAIVTLAKEGLLHTRQGSGTFVTERSDLLRCDVDLLKPWRDQLHTMGHTAKSRLIGTIDGARVPAELRRDVEYDSPDYVRFGEHLQEVDGVVIAITESWIPKESGGENARKSAPVVGISSIRVTFASTEQAHLMDAYRDVPLLEVVTCSRLRQTGALVELARTWWLASRVRFTYGRSLTLGDIDMTELLGAIATGGTQL